MPKYVIHVGFYVYLRKEQGTSEELIDKLAQVGADTHHGSGRRK